MLTGMIVTVVWQNSDVLKAFLDIKAPAVLISAATVVIVSLLDGNRDETVPVPAE
jgi:hypothetical protein